MKLLWTLKLYLLTTFFSVCFAQSDGSATSTTIIFDEDPRWLLLNNSAKKSVEVIIDDQVSNGCWTNSDAVATAVKLEFQRSGFDVTPTNEDLFRHQALLKAIGYSTNSSLCVISYSFHFRVIDVQERSFGGDNHTVTSLVYSDLYSNNGILSGGDTNSRLKTTFVEATQSFLVDISEYQKSLLEQIRKNTPQEGKSFWQSYSLE